MSHAHPPKTSNRVMRINTAISLASLLPHIFCCLLPTVAAAVSLATTVGVTAGGLAAKVNQNPIFRFIDAYHPYLLAIAVVGVLISGIISFIAYRIDCHNPHALEPLTGTHGHAACHHAPCGPKKLRAFRLFALSLALLTLDIAWFTAEHFLLHTH